MQTICIAGKNEIAVNALTYLIENYPQYTYVVIPNKTDTGETSWQPSLLLTARRLNVQVVNLTDIYSLENLIFFSLEFDLLIKPHRFKSKSLFNIHFSALPKYKGMFTSVFPLLNGDATSGVSLHIIDHGIDTGDIIDQIIFPLETDTTCKDLYELYLKHSFELFKNNLDAILSNQYTSFKQSAFGSSYFSKNSIDFSNIQIDLNKTAFEIRNQFSAFTFREFQLPKFRNWDISHTAISNTPSTRRAGTILYEDDTLFTLSTIDYNISLFKDYYSIFWNACKDGHYERVVSTLPYIPDINLRNNKGWNALILAVYNNHLEIARLLISNHADINATNYRGTTVCMYALSCYKNTSDDTMLEFILSCSPALESRDETGKNIFDYID